MDESREEARKKMADFVYNRARATGVDTEDPQVKANLNSMVEGMLDALREA